MPNITLSKWNTTGNNTFLEEDDPETWALTQVFQVILTVISIPFNSIIFYVLLVTRELRTPFNIYLMNLMAVNIVNGIFQCPLLIYAGLYRLWHLGSGWCTYHLYWGFHISPYLYNSHAIITLNRVWAMFWPLSYRRHHTRRVALLTCFAVWLVVHMCHTPLYLRDAILFRLPENQFGCQPYVHAQGFIMSIMYLTLYDLPILVIILMYPVILWKHFQRAAERRMLRGEPEVHVASSLKNTSNVGAMISDTADASTNMVHQAPQAIAPTLLQPKIRKSNGFLIVTLLTLTVAVCFIPINLFFNFQHFAPQFQTHELYTVAGMLIFIESILDPIYFIIAMRDLRQTLKNFFSRR